MDGVHHDAQYMLPVIPLPCNEQLHLTSRGATTCIAKKTTKIYVLPAFEQVNRYLPPAKLGPVIAVIVKQSVKQSVKQRGY